MSGMLLPHAQRIKAWKRGRVRATEMGQRAGPSISKTWMPTRVLMFCSLGTINVKQRRREREGGVVKSFCKEGTISEEQISQRREEYTWYEQRNALGKACGFILRVFIQLFHPQTLSLVPVFFLDRNPQVWASWNLRNTRELRKSAYVLFNLWIQESPRTRLCNTWGALKVHSGRLILLLIQSMPEEATNLYIAKLSGTLPK